MANVIYLKNGYVEYPSDWLLLPTEYEASECACAAVVEILNGARYDAPHAIFPVKEEQITASLYDWAEKAYQREWPGYVGLIPDMNGKPDAPSFGVFLVHDEDSVGGDYTAPCGVIIRHKGDA